MEFALLFIIAFIMGFLIYSINRQWMIAVLIPMALFLVSTLLDHEAKDAQKFSLIFGLPIVFFASLLGAYVLQLRTGEDEPQDDETIEK